MSAPEFPNSVRWFLRSQGLQLRTNLRGHVTAVLLWRLGCTHCLHALADLAALQAEFAGRPFLAVALHVPASAAESDTPRVLRAMRRHAPELVLGLDRDRQAFSAYGAAGYPTLVLIDALGDLRFSGRGEPKRDRLRAAIDGLLADGMARGALATVPIAPLRAQVPPAPTGLCQPSALCRDGDTLWIADSGHRRLLQCTPDGAVRRVVGGAALPAAWPTGLLPVTGGLLVADAGNHTLYRVDADGSAMVLGGTGRRGADKHGGGFGSQQPLASPHALLAVDAGIRVAMTGTHQLWHFDPDTTAWSVWLGTGEALRRDGGMESAFVQPTGLALDDNTVFVADAGSGALRAIDLGHGWVRTVSSELQRPVAVVLHAGVPVVADAWLGAVLRVRSGTAPEVLAGPAQGLVEPTALALLGDRLYVADAGADALFTLDLAAPAPQATVQPLLLRDLPPVEPAAAPAVVALRSSHLRAFAAASLALPLPLAPGESIADGALATVRLANDGGTVLAVERNATAPVHGGRLLLTNVAIGEPGTGSVRVLVEVEVDGGGGRTRRTFRFAWTIDASTDGATEAVLG